MSPRTGRPLAADTKRESMVYVRLSEGEIELLDDCAKQMKISRSGVVRKGIALVKAEMDKKKE